MGPMIRLLWCWAGAPAVVSRQRRHNWKSSSTGSVVELAADSCCQSTIRLAFIHFDGLDNQWIFDWLSWPVVCSSLICWSIYYSIIRLVLLVYFQKASDLLEELLETVAQLRPVGRAYLHHLIQPHLEGYRILSHSNRLKEVNHRRAIIDCRCHYFRQVRLGVRCRRHLLCHPISQRPLPSKKCSTTHRSMSNNEDVLSLSRSLSLSIAQKKNTRKIESDRDRLTVGCKYILSCDWIRKYI